MGLEFNQYPLIKEAAWKWFSESNGGLRTCVLSLKRHNDLRVKENLVKVMEWFGRDEHLKEMLTETLLRVSDHPKQYLLIISNILSALHESTYCSQRVSHSIICDQFLAYFRSYIGLLDRIWNAVSRTKGQLQDSIGCLR